MELESGAFCANSLFFFFFSYIRVNSGFPPRTSLGPSPPSMIIKLHLCGSKFGSLYYKDNEYTIRPQGLEGWSSGKRDAIFKSQTTSNVLKISQSHCRGFAFNKNEVVYPKKNV